MTIPILSTAIHHEHDVVSARQRARQIGALLGFDANEQTRIATAVSEVARNAYQYARGGVVDFAVEETPTPQLFVIRVKDHGPGIPHLQEVLDGQYRSPSGMGLGLVGTRRLMDHFDIASTEGVGTTILLKKTFPKRAARITTRDVTRISEDLARQRPQ